jgi:hypothetical protein
MSGKAKAVGSREAVLLSFLEGTLERKGGLKGAFKPW